jgi:hypothetical protein
MISLMPFRVPPLLVLIQLQPCHSLLLFLVRRIGMELRSPEEYSANEYSASAASTFGKHHVKVLDDEY